MIERIIGNAEPIGPPPGPLHQQLIDGGYAAQYSDAGNSHTMYIPPEIWLVAQNTPRQLDDVLDEARTYSQMTDTNVDTMVEDAVEREQDSRIAAYAHSSLTEADELREAAAEWAILRKRVDDPSREISSELLDGLFGYASDVAKPVPLKQLRNATAESIQLDVARKVVAEANLAYQVADARHQLEKPLRITNRATMLLGGGSILGAYQAHLKTNEYRNSQQATNVTMSQEASRPWYAHDEVAMGAVTAGLLLSAAYLAGKASLQRFAQYRAQRRVQIATTTPEN